MDLMPIIIALLIGELWPTSSWPLHLPRARNRSALEDGPWSPMSLYCNQLDEHFSFKNRARRVASAAPCYKRNNQRGL